MTAIQKSSWPVITAAFAVFTLAVTANATKAAAEEINFSYNLAAGTFSGPISFPDNIPVQLTGVCTTLGDRGVGEATLLSIPGAGGFIEWVGLDSTAGAALTQGFNGTPGTKIVFIDFAHQVQVEVDSPTTIRVHNIIGAQKTGVVTLTF